MLKAKTKQKHNRTKQNKNPQETSQVNKERRLKRKIQSRRVGEGGVVSKVKCFTDTGQKHWGGGLTLKVHRLGKSHSTGDRKYTTKAAVQLHYHKVPRKRWGPQLPVIKISHFSESSRTGLPSG